MGRNLRPLAIGLALVGAMLCGSVASAETANPSFTRSMNRFRAAVAARDLEAAQRQLAAAERWRARRTKRRSSNAAARSSNNWPISCRCSARA